MTTSLLLSAVAIACIFLSDNLSWMKGTAGLAWMLVLAIGVISGVFGGIFLAVKKKNPLWLTATIVALCMAYFVMALSYGLAIANMH